MTSTAISAQGSTLKISTGSGGAVNITSVDLANPCRVGFASVASFNKGDVVAIAGIAGTTQLNGNSYVVQYVDTVAKKITLAGVDGSAYTAWSAGGTATPTALTQVKNVESFSGFDGQSAQIDTTNLDSTAKEFLLGIADPGQFTATIDQDLTDAGQAACLVAKDARTLKSFVLTLPNAATVTFSGYVMRFGIAGGIDQKVKVPSMDIKISGAVVRA